MNTLLLADWCPGQKLLPLAVFGAFAAGAWWLLDLLATAKPRVEERLDEFKNPRSGAATKTRARPRNRPAMTKMLAAASPRSPGRLQPKSEAEASKLKSKLYYGRLPRRIAVSIFLGLKCVCLVAGLVVGGGAVLFTSGVNQKSLITVAIAGVLFYLPGIVLWFLAISARKASFWACPTRST